METGAIIMTPSELFSSPYTTISKPLFFLSFVIVLGWDDALKATIFSIRIGGYKCMQG